MISRLARRSAAVVTTATVGSRGERTVVHFCTAPGTGRFVATLALRHAGVGGVVGLGRLAKGRCAVAVGAARHHGYIAVKFGWRPAGKGLVARHAIGRGWDVVARFAGGAAAADVAAGTVGGDGKGAVVHLRSAPGAVGFVAALTLRHTGVNGVVGLGGLTKSRGSMTVRTTGNHRHIGVELGRGPAGKALVACHAIGRGWDVVARFGASCAAVMAAGAVGRTGKRAVIHLGTAPSCGPVARTAVGGRRYVITGFTRGRAAVVAAGAIGGAGKRAVIDLGPAPSRGFMARAAVGRCRHVISRFARSGAAVVAAGTVGRTGKGTVINFGATPHVGLMT